MRGMGWLAVGLVRRDRRERHRQRLAGRDALTAAMLDCVYVALALFAGTDVLSPISGALARKSLTRFRLVTQHAGPLLTSTDQAAQLGGNGLLGPGRAERVPHRPPGAHATHVMLDYQLAIGQLSITAGGILLFGFSVWISFWLAKTVRLMLQDEIMPHMALPRGVGNSISTLTYYAMIMIGIFFALAAAGFEIASSRWSSAPSASASASACRTS